MSRHYVTTPNGQRLPVAKGPHLEQLRLELSTGSADMDNLWLTISIICAYEALVGASPEERAKMIHALGGEVGDG